MCDALFRFLEIVEVEAEAEVEPSLRPLLRATEWLLNHAPQIVLLSRGKPQSLVQRVQHMLLKQALCSLRGSCILLVRGYTSQAAAVASALFELRLYSNYILDNHERAKVFVDHSNSQDFVWRPAVMMQYEAECNLRDSSHSGDPAAVQAEVERIRASYLFLCSLKHSNLIPLRHTVQAKDTIVGARFRDGGFPVIALPDTRPEDLPTKAIILVIANNATFYVTRNASLAVFEDTPEFEKWFQGLARCWHDAARESATYLSGLGPLPFPTIPRQSVEPPISFRRTGHDHDERARRTPS